MKPMFLVSHPKPGVTEFFGCAIQIIFMVWFVSQRVSRVHRIRLVLRVLCLVARVLAWWQGYRVAESLIMATINSFVG